MSFSVWYTMAKAVGDKTLIVEQIQAMITAHNSNPASHDNATEALGVHKLSDPMTHGGAFFPPTKAAADAKINTTFYCSNYGKLAYKDYYGRVYALY